MNFIMKQESKKADVKARKNAFGKRLGYKTEFAATTSRMRKLENELNRDAKIQKAVANRVKKG